MQELTAVGALREEARAEKTFYRNDDHIVCFCFLLKTNRERNVFFKVGVVRPPSGTYCVARGCQSARQPASGGGAGETSLADERERPEDPSGHLSLSLSLYLALSFSLSPYIYIYIYIYNCTEINIPQDGAGSGSGPTGHPVRDARGGPCPAAGTFGEAPRGS